MQARMSHGCLPISTKISCTGSYETYIVDVVYSVFVLNLREFDLYHTG